VAGGWQAGHHADAFREARVHGEQVDDFDHQHLHMGAAEDAEGNLKVSLIVSKVLLADQWLNQIKALNTAIDMWANQQTTTDSRVVVNQFTGFNAKTDTYDGIHPERSGKEKSDNNMIKLVKKALDTKKTTKSGSFRFIINVRATFANQKVVGLIEKAAIS
jgi:hypothetical protein